MIISLCGYEVYIDDEDYAKVSKYSWHIRKPSDKSHKNIYFMAHAGTNADGYRPVVCLHRLVMGCVPNDGKIVDHINLNTLDNRKCNLRICTNAENCRNKRMRVTNTVGLKGVTYNKKQRKYVAQICVDACVTYLGAYDTPEEAHAAYCEASKKYHGEFGRTE